MNHMATENTKRFWVRECMKVYNKYWKIHWTIYEILIDLATESGSNEELIKCPQSFFQLRLLINKSQLQLKHEQIDKKYNELLVSCNGFCMDYDDIATLFEIEIIVELCEMCNDNSIIAVSILREFRRLSY